MPQTPNVNPTMRLFGLEEIFVDAQTRDFCIQRLPWDSQFGGGAVRARNFALTFHQSGFDHLFLAIGDGSDKASCRATRLGCFTLQPTLVNRESVAVAEDD